MVELSTTHDEDIMELKDNLKGLSGSVAQSVATILANQERILAEVKAVKR